MIDLDSLRKKHNALAASLYGLGRGRGLDVILALEEADSFISVLLRELTQEREANNESEAIIHALADDRVGWRKLERFWCRHVRELSTQLRALSHPPVVPAGGEVYFMSYGWELFKGGLRSPADLAQAYRCLAWAIENNARPPHVDDNRQEPEAPSVDKAEVAKTWEERALKAEARVAELEAGPVVPVGWEVKIVDERWHLLFTMKGGEPCAVVTGTDWMHSMKSISMIAPATAVEALAWAHRYDRRPRHASDAAPKGPEYVPVDGDGIRFARVGR